MTGYGIVEIARVVVVVEALLTGKGGNVGIGAAGATCGGPRPLRGLSRLIGRGGGALCPGAISPG